MLCAVHWYVVCCTLVCCVLYTGTLCAVHWYVVCCTLVRCEGVGFKVTGIKFMTAFIVRKDAACFLAWVTTILPFYLPGKGIFYKYTSFGLQQLASCYA